MGTINDGPLSRGASQYMITVSDAGVQYFRAEGLEFDHLPKKRARDPQSSVTRPLARSVRPIQQENAEIEAVDQPVKVEVGWGINFPPQGEKLSEIKTINPTIAIHVAR